MSGRFSGPPTTPPDPDPIDTHEHEFIPTEDRPVLEDHSAKFTERCEWVERVGSYTSEEHDETFYGVGDECHETRSFKMDAVAVEKRREGTNITYLASEFDSSFPFLDAVFESVQSGEHTIIDSDPDKQTGHVVVQSRDWRIKYAADPEREVPPDSARESRRLRRAGIA
jgi:hypothetical protein